MLLQSHSLDGSRLIALCPYAIVVSAAVSSCSSIWITMGRTLTSRTDGTHSGQLKKIQLLWMSSTNSQYDR